MAGSYAPLLMVPSCVGLISAPFETWRGCSRYWDGSYLAVIAESEYQAIAAARALSTVSQWEERPTLPEPAERFDWLAAQPRQRVPVRDDLGEMPSGAQIVEARYRRENQTRESSGASCRGGW